MLPSSSSPVALTGACCALHVERPAVAVCSRCGSFTCDACLEVDELGQALCHSCLERVPEPAGRDTRFMANLIDSVVVLIPILPLFFLGRASNDVAMPMALLGLLGVAALLVYQGYLAGRFGQSIGKRMLGIRVVRSDGGPASFARILLLRNLLPGVLSNLCGLVGIVDALLIFGEERRCLHDLIADTRVVRARPPLED